MPEGVGKCRNPRCLNEWPGCWSKTNNKRMCPKCGAQFQIGKGYDEPVIPPQRSENVIYKIAKIQRNGKLVKVRRRVHV